MNGQKTESLSIKETRGAVGIFIVLPEGGPVGSIDYIAKGSLKSARDTAKSLAKKHPNVHWIIFSSVCGVVYNLDGKVK